MAESLLLRPHVTFSACRLGRDDWHVVVGRAPVFETADGLKTWEEVEGFVSGAWSRIERGR